MFLWYLEASPVFFWGWQKNIFPPQKIGPWPLAINAIANYKALLTPFKMGITVALLTGLQGEQNEGMYGNHQAVSYCHGSLSQRCCGESGSTNSCILCISSPGVAFPWSQWVSDVITSIQHRIRGLLTHSLSHPPGGFMTSPPGPVFSSCLVGSRPVAAAPHPGLLLSAYQNTATFFLFPLGSCLFSC